MLTTKDAPGTDADAQRQQQDLERPDDDQQREPEGTPADDGQGAGKPAADAPKPAAEKPADGKTPAPEAEDTTDWKAKFEDAENKRRDTQSKLDKHANAIKEHEAGLTNLDRAWRGWVERNAPDAYAKLVAHEQSQGKAREDGRTARSRSDSVILGIYREGDKAFGDYLTDLADSGATITPQSLERHRETFKKYAGAGAQNGHSTAPAPAATTTTTPPSPPRNPGAGRPAVEAAPAWDGKTFSSRKYLTEGLEKGDTRGKTPNPKRALLASR